MSKTNKTITLDQAFSRVAHLCSQKECCIFDIKQKLRRKELSDAEIEQIINKLIDEKYIDETRYTRSFIADKLRFNKWGAQKIKNHLRAKFIPTTIIENAFAEIENDLLTKALPDLLEKKRKSVKGQSDYEINTKLIRYALGKGFMMNDVLKCLKATNITDLPDED